MALVILAYFSLSSAHAGNKVEILRDSKLASIEGGYCMFWKCAGPPGNGSCQPIVNDAYHLCQNVSCTLSEGVEGNTQVIECKMKGAHETCSNVATYIECIRSHMPDLCLPDTTNAPCGNETDTYCFADVKSRQCYCDAGTGDKACDWVSCAY